MTFSARCIPLHNDLAAAWALAIVGTFFGCAAAAAGPRRVPAEFVDDRVFVAAPAPDGSTLRFYTDSGGGGNMIEASIAARFGLATVRTGDSSSTPTRSARRRSR